MWSLLRRWRRRWRKFQESSGGADTDYIDADADYTDTNYIDADHVSHLHLSHLANEGGASMQVYGWRKIGKTSPLKKDTGGEGWIEFQKSFDINCVLAEKRS